MRYLTQDWLDECVRLWSEMPERPGADARMAYTITDVPSTSGGTGVVEYSVEFRHGRIAASELGSVPDSDVHLSMSYPVAAAIVTGETDPNAAYADGRIRSEGDMRTLMGMFPILWPSPTARLGAAARYRALHGRIGVMTEF